jgi:hypothetical protein
MTLILRGDHCRCSICGAFFNSTRAFDKHRVGEWARRRCLAPEDMAAKGMSISRSGWWVASRWDGPVSTCSCDSTGDDLPCPATEGKGSAKNRSRIARPPAPGDFCCNALKYSGVEPRVGRFP